MSDQKIFAGPRVKRIRLGRELSQSAMAKGLGISPSYLNLIERNQRPLTVQLILKMSEIYHIAPSDLSGDQSGAAETLKTIYSDPLLQGELPGYEELFDLVDVAPNAANGIIKLHEGYRQALERLSELSASINDEGAGLEQSRSPEEQVRVLFENRPVYFEKLDLEAESFYKSLDLSLGMEAALRQHLYAQHHISVQALPIDTMPEWRRRYDKHSRRLFLSDRLGPKARISELATEIALLDMSEAINTEVRALALSTDDAKQIARQKLAKYGAMAIILPYGRFSQNATRMSYDVDALAARFDVSFSQVALRLCSLVKSKTAPKFFFLEVDVAGNLIQKLGACGFPKATFGGDCPKLPVFESMQSEGTLFSSFVEAFDNNNYVVIAKSAVSRSATNGTRERQTAVMLGMTSSDAYMTCYAGVAAGAAMKIGNNCRTCEIAHCPQRAQAPLSRPVALSDDESSVSDFNFCV